MRLFHWRRKDAAEEMAPAGLDAPALAAPMTHRQFLKMLIGAIGGAGLSLAATAPRRAEATYTPGSPSDTVDTNLTVQGNLIVTSGPNGPGNVGIGTTNPQGKLDVAGAISVNGAVAIDSAGVAGQSYYAP